MITDDGIEDSGGGSSSPDIFINVLFPVLNNPGLILIKKGFID